MTNITLAPGDVPAMLKQIRIEQGLSLQELGQLVYESNVVLSYRERGIRPVTLASVEQWARGLGYKVKIVLELDEVEESP